MLNSVLIWFTNNPLQSLGAMVAAVVVVALVALRPGIHEHVTQHHPRC